MKSKKRLIAILFLNLSMLFCACFYNSIDYENHKESIIEVALVYVNENTEEVENLKILSEIERDSFLTELSKLKRNSSDFAKLKGHCIKITYIDDSYSIIGVKVATRFSSYHEYMNLENGIASKDDLILLLSKYIELE